MPEYFGNFVAKLLAAAFTMDDPLMPAAISAKEQNSVSLFARTGLGISGLGSFERLQQ